MIEKVQSAPKPVENLKDNKDTDSSKDSDVFTALLSGIMGQNTNCLGNKTGGEITLDGEAEPALLNEADNIKGIVYEFADCKDPMQIMDDLLAADKEDILGDESLDVKQNIEAQYGLIQPSIDGEKGKLLEPPYIDLNSNTDDIALNTEPDAAVENKPNSKLSKLNNSIDDALHNTELEVNKGKDDIKDFVVPRAEFLKILNSDKDMKSSRTSDAYELKTGLPMAKDEAVDAEAKEKPVEQLNLGVGTKDKYGESEAKVKAGAVAHEDLSIGKKEEPEEAKDKLSMINAKHMNTNEDMVSQSQGTKNYDKISQNVSFDKNNVMDQIYDKIKSETGMDYTELHVKLKPEELGDVAIKLVMEKGVLTAKILVDDTLVKAMIESNLPDLKEQLKNQNINVSDFSVSLNIENDELLNKGFQDGSQNHSSNARGMVYGKNKKGIPVGLNEDILSRDVRSIIDGNLNMLI